MCPGHVYSHPYIFEHINVSCSICISAGGLHDAPALTVRYDITPTEYRHLGTFLQRAIEHRHTVCGRPWNDDRPDDTRESHYPRAVSRRCYDPWDAVPARSRARMLSPRQHGWPGRPHAYSSDVCREPSFTPPPTCDQPDHDAGRLGCRPPRD